MMKLILLVLSIASQVLALACTSKDIETGNVKNCDCDNTFSTCATKCSPERYGLNKCGNCGLGQNYKCTSCNVYYSSLGVCGCLKELINKSSACIGGKPWSGSGTPPVWTLHNGANPLISSTVLSAGVEDLAKMPDKNGGWELGMKNINHKSQALAMNSQSSRTENQIHIHICSKNRNAENELSSLDKSKYTTLSPVTGKNWPPKNVNVYCEAKASTPSSSVVDWLKTHTKEEPHVGIGVLTDTHGDWWTCASVGGAAEHIFC